jgi:hypothetical protein
MEWASLFIGGRDLRTKSFTVVLYDRTAGEEVLVETIGGRGKY